MGEMADYDDQNEFLMVNALDLSKPYDLENMHPYNTISNNGFLRS